MGDFILPATLYIMRAPASYTREDIVEIHTFGNPAIQESLIDRLVRLGARPAGPGEFTRRAFLNGRIDLAQAESVQAIVKARSDAECRAALGSLTGRLSDRIRELRDRLAELSAEVEVSLDFSDQDVEIISFRTVTERLRPIRDKLAHLLESKSEGGIRHYAVCATLFGPPNAGKSSLFNAILRRHRAIVSPTPGTTRDSIEALLVVKDIELLLVDTAGLHPPRDDIEAVAVARSHESVQRADLGLCVLDISRAPNDDALRAVAGLDPRRAIVILNKTDLGVRSSSLEPILPAVVETLSVSALTGDGIPDLVNRIVGRVRQGQVDRYPDELMVNARQEGLLNEALRALSRIPECNGVHAPMDLVAQDLREALFALSELTGDYVTEDVLDRIFSNFCVGK